MATRESVHDGRAPALEQRLTDLERVVRERAVASAYARFYPAMAIAAIILSLRPYYIDRGDEVSTFGNLWEIAAGFGGPASLGAFLLVVLVCVLTAAAIAPRSSAPPATICVLALILMALLLTKPATGTPKPDFTSDGMASVLVGGVMVAVGLAHAIHLVVHRSRHSR
jgi:hypothetical protein